MRLLILLLTPAIAPTLKPLFSYGMWDPFVSGSHILFLFPAGHSRIISPNVSPLQTPPPALSSDLTSHGGLCGGVLELPLDSPVVAALAIGAPARQPCPPHPPGGPALRRRTTSSSPRQRCRWRSRAQALGNMSDGICQGWHQPRHRGLGGSGRPTWLELKLQFSSSGSSDATLLRSFLCGIRWIQ